MKKNVDSGRTQNFYEDNKCFWGYVFRELRYSTTRSNSVHIKSVVFSETYYFAVYSTLRMNIDFVSMGRK